MPGTAFLLDLRPTTLEDAALVADLESLRDPAEPRDPVTLRHWWRMTEELERAMRRIAVQDGAAIAYIGATHELWPADEQRFGIVRPLVRGDFWSRARYEQLVGIGEDWLRAEGAATAVARIRADFELEIEALQRLGYREDRRMRISELDPIPNRDKILGPREECR